MTNHLGRAAILALALAAAPWAASAQNQITPGGRCSGPESDTRLYVNVSEIRNSTGWVAITLYADDSRRFLARHGSLYVGRHNARSPNLRACIYVPEPGVYALAIYHDEDQSGNFTRNGIGLPAEGFGFSNNASTFLGLPSFRSVRMNVSADGQETAIRMKYP